MISMTSGRLLTGPRPLFPPLPKCWTHILPRSCGVTFKCPGPGSRRTGVCAWVRFCENCSTDSTVANTAQSVYEEQSYLMMTSKWQPLRVLVCAVLLSNRSSAQKPTSKQWLHNHCKAYQEDYAPLVHRLLLRYQSGIKVAKVLDSKLPHGRSEPVMDNARPIVYLVNNTVHYADSKMAMRESRGLESAGFSVYFMPVIKRYNGVVCLV